MRRSVRRYDSDLETRAAYAAAVTSPEELRPDLAAPVGQLLLDYAGALESRGLSERIVGQATALLLMRLAWYHPTTPPSLAEVLGADDPFGWPFADRQRRLEAWSDWNPTIDEPPAGYILASILLDVRLSDDEGDTLRATSGALDIEVPGWRYRGTVMGIAARINAARQAQGHPPWQLPSVPTSPAGEHGPLDRECFATRPMTFREREIIIPNGAIWGEVIEPWQRQDVFAPMDARTRITKEAAPA